VSRTRALPKGGQKWPPFVTHAPQTEFTLQARLTCIISASLSGWFIQQLPIRNSDDLAEGVEHR
jgi:hypothetical protein